MSITLCDKILIGDIPQIKVKSKKESIELVDFWLENKDFTNSVFVCFQNWKHFENVRDEHQDILVSHNKEQIELFSQQTIDSIDLGDIDFCIFEFESYSESFKYCTDLREGF